MDFKPFQDRMLELQTTHGAKIIELDKQTQAEAREMADRERALVAERGSLANPGWLRQGGQHGAADRAERRLDQIRAELAEIANQKQTHRSEYNIKRADIVGRFIDEAQRVTLAANEARNEAVAELNRAYHQLYAPIEAAQADLQRTQQANIIFDSWKLEQKDKELYASTALRPRGV